jgi:hypothetical protein
MLGFILIFSLLSVVISFGDDLTLPVVNNWSSLTFSEKLNYLLTESDLEIYHQEFQLMSSSEPFSQQQSLDQTKLIPREDFLTYHLEFQNSESVEQFWKFCDRDQNEFLNLDEYIFCRGEMDCHGNPYERNEFDYLEEVVMKEFWDKMSRSDYQPQHYRYDEEGIIIDE